MTIEQIIAGWRTHATSGNLRYSCTPLFHFQVMVVAVVDTRITVEGKYLWCVYIAPVPGQNHDQEWWEVRRHGNLLPENIAKCLFPNMPDNMVYGDDL
jgi:hypothetical protein